MSYKELITFENEVTKLLNNNVSSLTIAKYISYLTTNCCNSIYVNDLESLINNDCTFRENHDLTNLLIKIISNTPKHIKEEIEQLIEPVPSFNLVFKHQQHNEETKFLYSHLKSFNSDKSDLLMDLCIQETFQNSDVYKILNIIPYVKPWIGFIYNNVDTDTLFKNIEFIKSLKYCKCIFVFSHSMMIKINHLLDSKQLKIITQLLYFPILESSFKFNFSKFISLKTIANVGTENLFSFYKIDFILQNNYFFNFKKTVIEMKKLGITNKYSDLSFFNNSFSDSSKWQTDLTKYITKIINSVKEVDNLKPDNFSNFLIFWNIENYPEKLLNECIVRNIPIIINKHPDIIKLLGEKYPLYYENEENIHTILLKFKQISSANKYLIKLNKTRLYNKLSINNFLCTLSSVIQKIDSSS